MYVAVLQLADQSRHHDPNGPAGQPDAARGAGNDFIKIELRSMLMAFAVLAVFGVGRIMNHWSE